MGALSSEPEMTTTVKEELAKVVAMCLEALAEQSRFEVSLETDFEGNERTIRELEGRRGNEPVTVEMGGNIALHLRRAINGNKVNAQGTHIVLLLLLKISLLAQQDAGIDVETLANAQKELESWFQQWETAKEAWAKYTQ
jgi:hypothetical protein